MVAQRYPDDRDCVWALGFPAAGAGYPRQKHRSFEADCLVAVQRQSGLDTNMEQHEPANVQALGTPAVLDTSDLPKLYKLLGSSSSKVRSA